METSRAADETGTKSLSSPWPLCGGAELLGIRFRLPPWAWYVAAVWTVLTTAGVVFGWVSMASVLAKEGAFASRCGAGGAPCNEQQLALNSVYTAASTFSYVIPLPIGIFLDAKGPRATVLLCLSIFTLGPAFAIAAAASGIHELYYPAFIAMGSAASSMLTPLYSVSNLFPGREGLLLSILNGSFDAASLVYQIMAVLHAHGVPLAVVWGAYMGAPLAVSWIIGLLVWRSQGFPLLDSAPAPSPADGKAARCPSPSNQAAEKQGQPVGAGLTVDTAAGSRPSPRSPPTSPGAARFAAVAAAAAASDSPSLAAAVAASEGGSIHGGRFMLGVPASAAASLVVAPAAGVAHGGIRTARSTSVGSLRALPEEPQETPTGSADVQEAADAMAVTVTAPPATQGSPDAPSLVGELTPMMADGGFDIQTLHALPFRKQVTTVEFVGFVAFFCVCMIRFNTFIGSVHPQMEAAGQAPDAPYTKLFGTILPLGFFAQFFIGAILDRGGTVAGLWSLWALGVLFSALNLWSPLEGHPATFLAFAFFRGFIFSNTSSYMARVFGFAHIGKSIGVAVLLGGLVSLLQQALLTWAYAAASGGPKPGFDRVNALLLALCASLAVFPAWLAQRGWAARMTRRRAVIVKAATAA